MLSVVDSISEVSVESGGRELQDESKTDKINNIGINFFIFAISFSLIRNHIPYFHYIISKIACQQKTYCSINFVLLHKY